MLAKKQEMKPDAETDVKLYNAMDKARRIVVDFHKNVLD